MGSMALAASMICPTNFDYKPKIEMENRLIVDTFQREKPKNILVLDNFTTPAISLDMDRVSDISHGNVVSQIIENGLPNTNVEKMDFKTRTPDENQDQKVQELMNIFYDTKQGKKKYEAINISIGPLTKFKTLSEKTKQAINPKNLASKTREIKDYFLERRYQQTNNDEDELLRNATNIMDALDSISSTGTKIYVAAGNHGTKEFNFFSLIDNAIVVGALDNENQKAIYTTDNTTVNRWKNGSLEIKKVGNGLTWTNNETPDIEGENLSNAFQIPAIFAIRGTSFASPKALVEDIKKENNK